MKRIISLLLVLVMALSLVACGASEAPAAPTQPTAAGKSVLNSARFSPVILPGAIFCNKHFRQSSAEIVAAAVTAYSVDTATVPNRDVKPYEDFKAEIQDTLDYIIEHDPNTEAIKHSIPGTLADLCAQW